MTRDDRCPCIPWVAALTFGLAMGLPRAASAALSLSIPGDGSIPGTNLPMLLPGTHYLDLVFAGDRVDGAPADEGLFAYDIVLRIVRPPGVTGGLTFSGAERPPDNFVLDVPSGASFSVASDPQLTNDSKITINVSSNNDLADITNGKKAARVFYTFSPGICATWQIVFDRDATVFGSASETYPTLAIPVDLRDATFICPEPGAVALLGVAGALVLRRRRA